MINFTPFSNDVCYLALITLYNNFGLLTLIEVRECHYKKGPKN